MYSRDLLMYNTPKLLANHWSPAAEEIFTKIYEAGLLSVELALTPAQEVTLKNQVVLGDDVTITLDLNGTNRSMVVNYIDSVASSTREVVRNTILTMDVKSWI